jgi:hypothetical protein
MAESVTRRRCLLVECDMPAGTWSAKEVTAFLAQVAPILNAEVWGEVSPRDVDGAWRKLTQLAREVEGRASYGDQVHSAYKAQSFWREAFPTRWWKEKRVGAARTDAP